MIAKAAKKPKKATKPATEKASAVFRDRVKRLDRIKASTLIANAGNWRIHPTPQREALRAAFGEIGFADVIICREARGGKLEIIDGHMRAEEAGEALVPVLVLDVTAAEAKRLMAYLDPIGDMAEVDPVKLEALLAELSPSDAALQGMLDNLAKQSGLEPTPKGKPVEFTAYDQSIEVEHQCPKCGYEWSGNAK